MKAIIVAAVAAISMGASIANAASYGGFPDPQYGTPWAAQQHAREMSSTGAQQQTSPSKADAGNSEHVAKGS